MEDDIKTNDEIATEQAASGAVGTASDPVAPAPVPASPVIFTDAEKAKIRTNIRWIMAELDYARSGRNADERATLNP